ncbi:MAG: hypothetical protein IJV05_01940, partial [Muribaculaceae bacterium]|nr:hypothetical protein [Muribaculaceae bacterium]
ALELAYGEINTAIGHDFLGLYYYFCHVCQWFLTGFYCRTKLGEIPDMAKSWATFCCPGCYKVISKICCGFKGSRNLSLYHRCKGTIIFWNQPNFLAII